MKTRKLFLLSISILILQFLFCSNGSDNPLTNDDNIIPNSPSFGLKFSSLHFNVYHEMTNNEYLTEIINYSELQYSRILEDLGIESLPMINAKFWNSTSGFYQYMDEKLGQIYQGATGYTPTATEFCILLQSNLDHDKMTVVHEFVHNVSLAKNITISNNPRWLWEAIALYESNDFINPAGLSFIQQGNYPTLEQLNTSFNDGNQIIYSIGFVLADYIVKTWGKPMLAQLITSNGNIQSSFGITVEEFETQWHTYIKDTYVN